MGLDRNTAVLAVDGGGTRCRFALEAGSERHIVTLGSANVATSFDSALATLCDGLSRLSTETGTPPETLKVLPAYFGLAGIVDASDAARVADALPLDRVTVEDDRRAAVRGALGLNDGALAGLGTGSFFARQAGGKIRLCGGWGARLGDQASGFWIAREALAATLDVHDRLRQPSGLTAELTRRFEGPRGIVTFSLGATGTDFAELAPLVINAATTGDAIAEDVMQRGAAHVTETLAALGWTPGEALCLVGGVADSYRACLASEAAASVVDPLGSGLDGALALARDLTAEVTA